ncbi:hypothetical protein [Polaribacter sp. Hel1_85]|uniref:hypothetical protein n=1 Tax=Polaribacter sp. Hel1_85 TaxID=1250005 RepID=UPI00052DB5D7|nr:hypothetical protein [Polaribacter sp. Hel1_85]KGL62748.1 hypothetical protein PHEL85_2542 [Polaribacter sp. Hel1_85]
MKKLLPIMLLFLATQTSFSQEKLGKPFFTGSGNVTLSINEHYTLDPDDGEPFLVPNAIFFRMGFGYEFKKRVALSVNGGFDYHWNYAVSAFPTYFSLKYNITEDQGDNFFTEVSYGKMWRPSVNYPDGNYYRIGLGTQVAGSARWNTIFRLDFHRKGIIGFENNRLDSISLGIGFLFF